MARERKATPRGEWAETTRKKQREYQKRARATVSADVDRETADRFREYCKSRGASVSSTIAAYIYSVVGRPGEDQETDEASGDLLHAPGDQETTADQIDRRGDDQTTADAAAVSADQIGAGSLDQGGPATASQRDQTSDREGQNDTPGPVGLPTANDTPGTVDWPKNLCNMTNTQIFPAE